MADQRGDGPKPGAILRPEAGATPPPASTLVDALKDDERKPGETIVIRGYLGPSDVFDRAVAYVRKLGTDDGINRNIKELAEKIDVVVADAESRRQLRERASLRIYLSPNLDRYVEFNWHEDVLAYRLEAHLDRGDAYTVWLRTRGPNNAPKQYEIVQTTPLVPPATGYIGGSLIDDYLLQSDSESVVWDGQYGPITGRHTGRYCVG
jgi:hypothetical protein